MHKRDQAMRSHFHEAAARRGFSVAPAQQAAVGRLSRLAAELARPTWTFPKPPRDLYVWGPVGRGKSWLVDTFTRACLPDANAACTSTTSSGACTTE